MLLLVIRAYYIAQEYKLAIQQLAKFNKHSNTSSFLKGKEMLLNNSLAEAIIHFDKGVSEFGLQLISAISKKFRLFLQDPNYGKYKKFIRLFTVLVKGISDEEKAHFLEQSNLFSEEYRLTTIDYELIALDAWLISKTENKNYYEIYLKML